MLKWGDWHFRYLIFSRFIIFTFRNYFTLCKAVLYIWRKIFLFSAKIILWKQIIQSCLKMNLCICIRKVGARIRAGGGSLYEGGGIVWNTFKRGGMEKKGVETKILKMRGKLGKGIGALNKRGRGGGGWNPFMNYGWRFPCLTKIRL